MTVLAKFLSKLFINNTLKVLYLFFAILINIENNSKYERYIAELFKSNLKPLKASKEYYVKSTDEYPILFVIAALINGTSVFKGINDLANKESNRIKEMQKILKQINIKSVVKKDQIKIYGKGLIDGRNKKIIVPNKKMEKAR